MERFDSSKSKLLMKQMWTGEQCAPNIEYANWNFFQHKLSFFLSIHFLFSFVGWFGKLFTIENNNGSVCKSVWNVILEQHRCTMHIQCLYTVYIISIKYKIKYILLNTKHQTANHECSRFHSHSTMKNYSQYEIQHSLFTITRIQIVNAFGYFPSLVV